MCVVLGPGHGCSQVRLIRLFSASASLGPQQQRTFRLPEGEAVEAPSCWAPCSPRLPFSPSDTAQEVGRLPPEGAGDVGWPQACSPLDLKAKVRLAGQG